MNSFNKYEGFEKLGEIKHFILNLFLPDFKQKNLKNFTPEQQIHAMASYETCLTLLLVDSICARLKDESKETIKSEWDISITTLKKFVKDRIGIDF